MEIIDRLKNIIKSNYYLFILGDFLVKNFGLVFEKEFFILKYYKFPINGLAIDIGAHRGESLLEISKYHNNIISFEANPNLYNEIKKKIKNLNNNKIKVTLNKCGISNNNNEITMYIPCIDKYEMTMWASLNKKLIIERMNKHLKFRYKKKFKFKKINIKTKKLDYFKYKAYFIKIDTEGYEFNAIKSSEKTIKTYNPLILIEYNDSNYDKIYKFLSKYKYKRYEYTLFKSKIFLREIKQERLKMIKKSSNSKNIFYINSIAKRRLDKNYINFK